MLNPDTNQFIDCSFYVVSRDDDNYPFYYKHNYKYVHSCQTVQWVHGHMALHAFSILHTVVTFRVPQCCVLPNYRSQFGAVGLLRWLACVPHWGQCQH